MHTRDNHGLARALSVSGISVFVGIFLMIVLSVWVGLFVLVLGLIAFEGFARGRWDPDARFPGRPG